MVTLHILVEVGAELLPSLIRNAGVHELRWRTTSREHADAAQDAEVFDVVAVDENTHLCTLP